MGASRGAHWQHTRRPFPLVLTPIVPQHIASMGRCDDGIPGGTASRCLSPPGSTASRTTGGAAKSHRQAGSRVAALDVETPKPNQRSPFLHSTSWKYLSRRAYALAASAAGLASCFHSFGTAMCIRRAYRARLRGNAVGWTCSFPRRALEC